MRALKIITLVLVLLAALDPISAEAHGRRWHYYGGAWVWGWGLPLYYGPYGYPYPYPYPAPSSTVVIERAAPVAQPLQPQQQFWYYCESTGSYYPYVPTCKETWRMVPVTPPAPTPSGAPPQ